MKEKNVKKCKLTGGGANSKSIKKTLPVILLLLLITIIIGVTYAAYLVTLQSSENSITTGLVSMSYTESTNVISIENALPISDEDGKKSTDYFDFSVTSNITLNENDPKVKLSYTIDLEPLSTNTLSSNQIKVYLEDTTGTTNKVLVDSKLISNLSNYTLYSTSHTHKYNVNTVTTNYRLRAWIDYYVDSSDWTSSKTYEYKFRVNVNGDTEVIEAASIPTGSALATVANSVTAANISYKYINGANQTIDGIAYNVNDNGLFLYDGTDDNAGEYPIYYYRGNVTNNNVLFANMCWKIVRTTSTGGIKLIYNGVPTDGACNNTGSSAQIGTSAFNSSYNSPAYVGYMYGTAYTYSSKSMSSVTDTIIYGNDVTYSDGTYTLKDTKSSTSWSSDRTTLANGYHYTCFTSETTCSNVYYITYFGDSSYAYYLTFTGGDTLETAKEKMYTNTKNSTIKTTIDNWYKTNLTSYTNYLENTIFCNDRSSASDETYTVTRWGSSYTENGGALSSKDTNPGTTTDGYSYFKSYENTGKGTPSLQCENQNDRFSLSTSNGGTEGYGNNALIYPVGLLTLDEANLAGGQYTSNSNYYLYTGNYYWVLSPAFWAGRWADGGRVDSVGGLYWNGVYISGGARAVVSLQLGTEFEAGTDGTASNPYKVKTS